MKKISLKRLSNHQKFMIIIPIILIGGILLFYLLNKSSKTEPEQLPQAFHSQLTGIEVDADTAKHPILGVMIENHPASRPQIGLDDAGIVFETVTEGGITRYLGLYQENMPKKFGPIRSVRSYFLDWAMGFDASIAHVGGSANALTLIDSRGTKSLSQLKYPDPYTRINTREAPHNMYASSDLLQNLQQRLGHKTAKFNEIPRSSDGPSQNPEVTSIKIDYSSPEYAVEFRYQKNNNTYIRYLNEKPDIDAVTKKPITLNNLIAITMPSNIIQPIGSGEALVFKDGNVKTANWRQSSYKERITLTDIQGNEMSLNRGDTWFAVLPSTGSVSHSTN